MALEIFLDRNRGDLIELFWKPLDTTFAAFRLYTDTVHTGVFATLVKEIANVANPPGLRLPGSVGIALSRTDLSIAQTDAAYFLITSVDNAAVESAKALSPVRTVFPVGSIPATIAVSDTKQTFSLPFVSRWFSAANAGGNDVFLDIPGQTIQIASGGTFDLGLISVNVITAYCGAGKTSTVQIAGSPVNF